MAETNGSETFQLMQKEPWEELEQRLKANGFCMADIGISGGGIATNYQNLETGILYFIKLGENDGMAQITAKIEKIPTLKTDMSDEDIMDAAFPACSPKATPHLSGVRTGANLLAY